MRKTIYIAGSFAGRARIRAMANVLESEGHTVLSQWFKDEDFVERAWDQNFGGRVAEAMAHRDFVGVMQCDVFILDTMEPSTTGGRYVELGLAIHRQIVGQPVKIIHVGPPSNIFETLVHWHYDTWTDVIIEEVDTWRN